MEFIRSETENRTFLSILFISLLCIILVSVSTTLIYAVPAAAPLLIFGIPAGKFVWGTVSVGLAGLTIWGTVEMLNKDLEEQIKGLGDEVVALTIVKSNAKRDKDNAQTEVDRLKPLYEAASTNLSTAQSALETAKANTAMAKSAYDNSVYHENWAYNSYMTHVASCSICSGQTMCPDGHRLYNKWQALKKQLASDRTAYNSAKTAQKNREKGLSDAKMNYYTVEGNYNMWLFALNLATNTYNTATTALDTKLEELAAKKVEKAINDATIENAEGQTEEAISTLDAAERDYPEAWSEAMTDTDLAAQVQVVRDGWNEMGGQ